MDIVGCFIKNVLKDWEVKDRAILSGQSLPPGITEITGVPYDQDGVRGHLLDVYYPEGAQNRLPVIIDIHGGGFFYGYKELNRIYGYHLAKRGFIVFNLNYRLAFNGDDTKVPDQIRDVVQAVNWIGDSIDAYPADPERIYITGESAGAVLAVMASFAGKSERLRQLFNLPPLKLNIRAAALVCGMMNIEDWQFPYWCVRHLCLERGYKKQEYYRNLIFDNVPEIKDLPPVFLASNGDDPLHYMTFNFEKVLRKYGAFYQLQYFPKTAEKRLGHVFSVMRPALKESAEVMDMMTGFFLSQ